jgi:hypothetical protein
LLAFFWGSLLEDFTRISGMGKALEKTNYFITI